MRRFRLSLPLLLVVLATCTDGVTSSHAPRELRPDGSPLRADSYQNVCTPILIDPIVPTQIICASNNDPTALNLTFFSANFHITGTATRTNCTPSVCTGLTFQLDPDPTACVGPVGTTCPMGITVEDTYLNGPPIVRVNGNFSYVVGGGGPPPATHFAITAVGNHGVGVCDHFLITPVDAAGNPASFGIPVVVTFQSAHAVSLFGDLGCSLSTMIANVPAGSTPANVYGIWNAAGPQTVTATAGNGAPVTAAPVNVAPGTPTLTLDQTTITANQASSITLGATLSSRAPTNGLAITWFLPGTPNAGTTTTDANGHATLTVTLPSTITPGTYANGFGATFGGNQNFNPTVVDGLLIVDEPVSYRLIAPVQHVPYGPNEALSVTLLANGVPVKGQEVSFHVSFEPGFAIDYTATTDANGVATVNIGKHGAGTGIAYAAQAGSLASGFAHFTIDPVPATVTANNQFRLYGDPNRPFTFGVGGVVTGDDPAGFGITCTSPATINSNVGTFPITCAGGASPNYLFTYQGGVETILPAPITLRVGSMTVIYPFRSSDLSDVLITADGMKLEQNTSVLNMVTTTSATPSSGFGVFPVGATINDPNYSATVVPGKLTIIPNVVIEAPLGGTTPNNPLESNDRRTIPFDIHATDRDEHPLNGATFRIDVSKLVGSTQTPITLPNSLFREDGANGRYIYHIGTDMLVPGLYQLGLSGTFRQPSGATPVPLPNAAYVLVK